jgi:GntR family carbon starvation induced transcriptional regulator
MKLQKDRKAPNTASAATPADDSTRDQPMLTTTLTRTVYEELRADVLSGKLRPGEKLAAEALRARFCTGSSPIREALNRLFSEGFVALEEQKGFRVAPISRQELNELVLARIWIDGAAIGESVKRFDPAWEEKLVLALHRLVKTPRQPQQVNTDPEWEQRHKAFHLALVEGCGSQWIVRISQQLFDAATRYRLLSTNYQSDRDHLEEHRAIANACLERNAARAIDLLGAHYNETYDIVKSSLSSSTQSQSSLPE